MNMNSGFHSIFVARILGVIQIRVMITLSLSFGISSATLSQRDSRSLCLSLCSGLVLRYCWVLLREHEQC